MKTSLKPMIGLFWFIPGLAGSNFIGASSPFNEVPLIGGFRTLDIGHVDVWPKFQKAHPAIRSIGYEAFPRGRVNWRESDDLFLILVDQSIIDQGAISTLIDEWKLPENTLVMTDSHYRTHRFTSAVRETR